MTAPGPSATTRARTRRADAQRSVVAIIEAARTILVQRPDASMDEIAEAAGVSRQTVYAHFSSRDVLTAAVIEAQRDAQLAVLVDARLDRLAPVDAVRTFLGISWQLVDRFPPLLDLALTRTPHPEGDDHHRPVADVLERIIRRGQRIGVFDRSLSARWLTAATFGLGHSAAELVARGEIDLTAAAIALETSVLRLYGTTP